MKIEHIAKAAYGIARAYEKTVSHVWEDITDAKKASVIKNVGIVLDSSPCTSSVIHDAWVLEKENDGWVYGEELNEEAKTHPYIVLFDLLPEDQQGYDRIFIAAVTELNEIPVETITKEVIVNVPAKASKGNTEGLTPVKYIGHRERHKDAIYGTNITWLNGETQLVANDKALLMLKHADVYALGNAKGAAVAEVKDPNREDDTDEELQNARDTVQAMDIEGLRRYANDNFGGHKLPGKISVEKARIAVINLIDQFGLK